MRSDDIKQLAADIRAGNAPPVEITARTTDNWITMAELERMTAREIVTYIFLLESRDDKLGELLAAIPECPTHGPCMPHALQWIKEARRAKKTANER